MHLPKNEILRKLVSRQAKSVNQNYSFDISRRKFLKNTSSLVVGVSLTPFASSCKPLLDLSKQSSPKVTIIGAGIAGLSCAHHLKKRGIVANVLEASSSVGGRIETLPNYFGDGINAELGGEFVDSNHLDMIELSREFELDLVDTFEDYFESNVIKDSYYFHGQSYSENDISKAFESIASQINDDKLLCGEDYDTPRCMELDYISLEEYVQGFECESFLKDLLINAFVAEFGLDAGEQSCLNLVDLIGTDTRNGFKIFGVSDERYRIKGGNQLLVESLSRSLESQISTGVKLTKVQKKNNGYLLSFDNSPDLKTDFLVITIPFTALRNVELDLKNVDPLKTKCINELGYGLNNKLLLGFESRPWRESSNPSSGYLFSNEIQNGWDCGHMQNNNSGSTAYTILLGGSKSIKLSNGQLDERGSKIDPQIVSSYYSEIQSVFQNSQGQQSNKHFGAIWSKNPYVNCSYTCYTLGQWTGISGYEIEPIDDSLLFAGEHCSDAFQGYMNGGAETGRRAAERIFMSLE